MAGAGAGISSLVSKEAILRRCRMTIVWDKLSQEVKTWGVGLIAPPHRAWVKCAEKYRDRLNPCHALEKNWKTWNGRTLRLTPN